jgi:hypothetical protein
MIPSLIGCVLALVAIRDVFGNVVPTSIAPPKTVNDPLTSCDVVHQPPTRSRNVIVRLERDLEHRLDEAFAVVGSGRAECPSPSETGIGDVFDTRQFLASREQTKHPPMLPS